MKRYRCLGKRRITDKNELVITTVLLDIHPGRKRPPLSMFAFRGELCPVLIKHIAAVLTYPLSINKIPVYKHSPTATIKDVSRILKVKLSYIYQLP